MNQIFTLLLHLFGLLHLTAPTAPSTLPEVKLPSTFNCQGGSLYIIAHPDDDLLFQNPDLLTELKNQSRCVTSLYLTSGDAGLGSDYAIGREAGSKAAYSVMISGQATQPSRNTWTTTIGSLANQRVVIETFDANPNVQKLWLRIPDGNYLGIGFSTTTSVSLKQLYARQIQAIHTLPESVPSTSPSPHNGMDTSHSSYTLEALKQAIAEVVTATKPAVVRTQDWQGEGRGDHSDHYTTAKLVQEVVAGKNIQVVGYVDYVCASWPANVPTGSVNYTAKSDAFFAYTKHDAQECQSLDDCRRKGVGEPYWLERQYRIGDPVP